jgi:ubiquinone/menaquinone biosynthesis C-methylase UbiE
MQLYDELMVPRLFGPWGRLLVDQLAIGPGEAVLDVACGPGAATRLAAERVGGAGRVTGCDLSGAMLAVARAKKPVRGGAAITYLEGPADQLPVEDGAFDVAICQQGLQFFPDRRAALGEMRRALRPGGRVGIAVWAEIDRSPAFWAVWKGVEEVVGAEPAARYRGGPFGFPDGELLGEELESAGFQDVRVPRHVLPVRFEEGPAQLLATLATTPLAADIAQLSAEQKQRLVGAVARRTGDGPVESHVEANVALARRYGGSRT